MNEEIVATKLLSLLRARSRISHDYSWAGVLTLWAVTWFFITMYLLWGLTLFPLPNVISGAFAVTVLVQYFLVHRDPKSHAEARSSRLGGLWSLSALIQGTILLLFPLGGICTQGASFSLTSVILAGTLVVTGLLKQKRNLMVASLILWVGMPLGWIFLKGNDNAVATSALICLALGLGAWFTRNTTTQKLS
jgi:hypothetical protein